jgi:hypothetical protein
MGQFHDVEQADVSLSALDPAHVIAVQLRQLGELLLREIAFHSQLADTPSEIASRTSDTTEQVRQALLEAFGNLLDIHE